VIFFPAASADLPKGNQGSLSTRDSLGSAEEIENSSGKNMLHQSCDRIRHWSVSLRITVAMIFTGGGVAAVANATEPGMNASAAASMEPAAGFFVDPATGIVYRQFRRAVERQVLETEVETREATVYRPEVVVEVRPETRTVREPVVSYIWEPRVINRWNPFAMPTVRYEHVPKTHWENRDETVRHRETRTTWVPENRQIEVPKSVLKIRREELLEYEAVGRIPPEPGHDAATMSQAVATRLKPIASPLGDPRFLPAPTLAQSGISSDQVAERSREQVGMRATELQPSRYNPLLPPPGFGGLARQPGSSLRR